MIRISERLKTAAGLIGEGKRLADVGTDHGYVPIYLLAQGRIPCAIAMDINRGPIQRAQEHIRQYGMEAYIQTRLSDGVAALREGEVDTILIAGMGGGLVMHILESGSSVCKSVDELVLQPQSELARVRKFLAENGYVIEAEEMVKEDGKYYPMMRVHYAPRTMDAPSVERELAFSYGELLLKEKHPVLFDYLKWERRIQEGIKSRLQEQPLTEQIEARLDEVEHILAQNERALSYFKEESETSVPE